MQIRVANSKDAAALDSILQDLISAGQRSKASDVDFVRSHYLNHPAQIQCAIAIDQDGHALGFQSLKRAKQGNVYGTTIGWGIIGTHIRPSAARQGVGKRLFEHTKYAAQTHNIPEIEALIGAENAPALAFYDSLGFRTYKKTEQAVGKSFKLL